MKVRARTSGSHLVQGLPMQRFLNETETCIAKYDSIVALNKKPRGPKCAAI